MSIPVFGPTRGPAAAVTTPELYDYDRVLAAICIAEELRGECYGWPHGAYALRHHAITLSHYAELYWNALNEGDAMDGIAYDVEYIPAFLEIALDASGYLKKEALADLIEWRNRETA